MNLNRLFTTLKSYRKENIKLTFYCPSHILDYANSKALMQGFNILLSMLLCFTVSFILNYFYF